MLNVQFSPKESLRTILNIQLKTGNASSIFQVLVLIFLCSCTVQKRISKSAKADLLSSPALQTAHLGISIYEPSTGKYWYDYNSEKYFVPASNVKIPTCYAAMKYLGDSLVGLRYGFTDSTYRGLLIIEPTGDPSFLHPDFKQHPVLNFLKQQSSDPKLSIGFVDAKWRDDRWGAGWSWNDFQEPYMAERSSMPVLGNVLKIRLKDVADRKIDSSLRRPVYSVFKT